jgi:hypothetical protein
MINFFKKKIHARLSTRRKDIRNFAFTQDASVKIDINEKYRYDGDLLKIFSENSGPLVHKWHHYIPIYSRYFSRFRATKVRFLEIGVSKGGSLTMWRKYFGEDAIIFGIDIDPDCAQYDNISGNVRIGSQVDENFLKSVIEEMGGVDIILDDGSHHMNHIPKTLNVLYPFLSENGVYMIEDLHTAYWPRYGGGYHSKKNFFHMTRGLIDDMHHWYHGKNIKFPKISKECAAIHIHDSIVVLEKNKVFAPVHSQNPSEN